MDFRHVLIAMLFIVVGYYVGANYKQGWPLLG